MAFVDTNPATAALIGILAASVLYGLNVVVFFTCLYVILQRHAGGNGVPWFIFGGAIVQFIVSTIHIGNCWRQLLEAFIWKAEIPGASFAYFVEDPAKPTEVLAKTLAIIDSFLTDSILVWRLYMVWGRNLYVCIVPMVIISAYMITYCIGLGKLGQLPPTHGNFFVISQWFVAGLGLTLATHILVTCLIAGRIWGAARANSIYAGQTRHMAVIWTIVESGAIYSLAVIFLVVFVDLKTQAGGVISNLFVQLCGLIPTLIIVRVGLGLTSDVTARNRDAFPTALQFDRTVDSDTHELPSIVNVPPEHAGKQGVRWDDS